MTTLPCRDALRAVFDDVVFEIDRARDKQRLTKPFYARVADAVFNTCYGALKDACEATADPKSRSRLSRVNVLSASVGSGKSTFSRAFMVALTRYAASNGLPPYGCVFLADQIANAEEAYRELSTLLPPNTVAIWTSAHDADDEKQANSGDGRPRFGVSELQHYAVVVVTHKFYSDTRGYKAKNIRLPDGSRTSRMLTLIDEQVSQVHVYEVHASEAVKVYEFAKDTAKLATSVAPKLSALVAFMTDRSAEGHSRDLEKPTDDTGAWSVIDTMSWFGTEDAARCCRSYSLQCPEMVNVFGFARALYNNCAFVNRTRGGEGLTYFMGYRSDLKPVPGMVLMDATADVDGYSQLCLWRTMHEVPKARYDNLSIVHVPSLTKERLSTFLKSVSNRRAYRTHMEDVIRAHMKPGERALVVVKKDLVVNEHVPAPLGKFDWEFEGRHLAVTHWGAGIGNNAWQDAEAVFLFDEFYIPKRHVIATTQGLRGHKATEGALKTMNTLNTKSAPVDTVFDGHLLRYSRQMALRGNARHLDDNGVCGHQRLVCTGNVDRLVSNMERLFPGAKITITAADEGHQRRHRLYELLSDETLPSSVSTGWVGQQFGRPWREIRGSLKPDPGALAAIGWRYAPKPGRGGGGFERLPKTASLAA